MSGLAARFRVQRDAMAVDVELSVEPGRTVALLGPNGAGKSTVVGALAGLVPIDAGRIVLDGRVLSDPAAGVAVLPGKRGIGVVFQELALFPGMSVLDNIAFGPRSRGVADPEGVARAWAVRLTVDHLADAYPGRLSGGEAQRVALARALADGPAMLLLDEPMAALDVAARAETRRLLSEHLAQLPGPRLLVTHDPVEAFMIADDIVVLEEGVIVQRGTPDEIRLRPRTRFVADLAGVNLFEGRADGTQVVVGEHSVQTATPADGPVLVTIHPRAAALHRETPAGSPRNTWRTIVVAVDHHGDRVRVGLGEPLRVTAEVTPAAVEALGIGVGSNCWVSIKATEITVTAD